MSYRLELDESFADGLKRIVREQSDKALAQLTEPTDDRNEAVHDARKRFKKIRAAIRLVRDEVGESFYKRENVRYRDAGRMLSDVRDSYVHIETVDELKERYAEQLTEDAFETVRQNLVECHEQMIAQVLDEDDAMEKVAAEVRHGQQFIAEWPIAHNDFSALEGGLKRVYKRGYKGQAKSYDNPTVENFHDWRKRIKYLWYHSRILKPIFPDLLGSYASALHDLSDYLGDDHDLAELQETIEQNPALCPDEKERELLFGLIKQGHSDLRGQAEPLSERLYAEPPTNFIKRMEAYWNTTY